MSVSTSDGLTIRVQGGDSAGSAQPQGWPALRRQPCPAEHGRIDVRVNSGAELLPYYSESWFTAEGARLKARRLQRAGLPNFSNWRFITLTVANRSMPPWVAYKVGKDRIRRFLARFRKAIGRSFRWCWKLEFHEDGYAHWHLLVEYTKRIPPEMLEVVEGWWGLGRISIQRVKRRDIRYVFKYVAKGMDDLPEWVIRHKGRLRVFQASRLFYTRRRARTTKPAEPRSSLVRVDLLTRQAWDSRKALMIATDYDGTRRVRAVKLRITFNSLLLARAYEAVRLRRQLGPPGVVCINPHQAEELRQESRMFAGLGRIPV